MSTFTYGVMHLEFLLLKAMFEEHEYWDGRSINVSVLAHSHHTITVHGLPSEELEFLKPS